MGNKMFPFITGVCNPLGGKCIHECYKGGCWSNIISSKYGLKKYIGPPKIDEEVFKHPTKARNQPFIDGDYIFLCDMVDLFAENVPYDMINRVLDIPRRFPNVRFLLLTKNPKRYQKILEIIPQNCTIGATIESNRPYPEWGKAADQMSRLMAMGQIRMETDHQMLISIEPIFDFDFTLAEWLVKMQPCSIALGYDNYKNGFPEPTLKKTEELIKFLETNNIEVIRKTIRKAWYEK